MSTSTEDRVAEGIALLRDLQLYYEPIITEENLPYVVAASIISGGPFFNFSGELRDLLDAIDRARECVDLTLKQVVKWSDLAAQEEINKKA